ncbi:MAG: malate dehydrogenase [Methanosarcinales archaeon Met12]|nr:MAG: malate dehydrogenase [Methanosarcinales archaeon Met12]
MVKIGFVGAGRIGSTSAYATLYDVDCDEIVLIDLVEDLAVGEAMDLGAAAIATGKSAIVEGGSDYSLLSDSNVIVISAGIARKPGMTRLDLTRTNANIMCDVIKRVNETVPDAILVLVTNPVDVMTYVAYKASGKARNEVLGMGSSHDTARLKEQLLRLNVKSDALVIGEHGDSMTLIKGQKEIEGVDWNKIVQTTKEKGMEIIRRKSATYYAPASCIAKIVKAIVSDEDAMIPVSVVLEGEYGLRDVAIGVPALIGKNGVSSVLEYDLTEEELIQLKRSADIIKGMLKSI